MPSAGYRQSNRNAAASQVAAPAVNVLSIGALDATAATGILADLKTFTALRTYGCAVATALALKDTARLHEVRPLEPQAVAAVLDALGGDVRFAAIKVGLLPEAKTLAHVARWLEQLPQAAAPAPALHRVLDPGWITASGTSLADKPVQHLWRETLLPQATTLSLSLLDAAALLERSVATSRREMHQSAEALRESMAHSGTRWVIVRAATLADSLADLVFDGDRMVELDQPRYEAEVPGAGGALSAALAALLAQGADMPQAAIAARAYVAAGVAQRDALAVGAGAVLHHSHVSWHSAGRDADHG